VEGKRDRTRRESVRLELEGRRTCRKRSISVASEVPDARSPAGASATARRTVVETAEEAALRGYAEKLAEEVDRKLHEGAAAAGWRVMEQWPGGGRAGKWFYFAPDGSKYRSAADANNHEGGVDQHSGEGSRSASNDHDAASPCSGYGNDDSDGSAGGDEAEAGLHGGAGDGNGDVAQDESTAEHEGEQAGSFGLDAHSSASPIQRYAHTPACPAEAGLQQRLEDAEALARKWERLARHYHGLLVNAHDAGKRLFPLAKTMVGLAGGTLPMPGPLRPLIIEPIPEVL
jgi:hypothetical protein